jgi:hypothetical protein
LLLEVTQRQAKHFRLKPLTNSSDIAISLEYIRPIVTTLYINTRTSINVAGIRPQVREKRKEDREEGHAK